MITLAIYLFLLTLDNMECFIDSNAIREIYFCDLRGQCGAIGDFNLLIKTPCTELDLIEFVFKEQTYRKFITPDLKLVDKSNPCKNITDSLISPALASNISTNDLTSNTTTSKNSIELIFNEFRQFIYLMFDELNDFVSYFIFLVLFMLLFWLKKRIYDFLLFFKNYMINLFKKKNLNQNVYEAPSNVNYLFPEIKVNASAPYITNENMFRIETENIETSKRLKTYEVEKIESHKPCMCNTTSCDNNMCGCFENGRKCSIECHKNKQHKNCLNC